MKTAKYIYAILLLLFIPFLSFGQVNNTITDPKVKAIMDSINKAQEKKTAPAQNTTISNTNDTVGTIIQDTTMMENQMIDSASLNNINLLQDGNTNVSGKAARIERLKNEDKLRIENEKRMEQAEKEEIENRKEFLKQEEERKKEIMKQREEAEKEDERIRIENAKRIDKEIKENRKRLEDME